MPREPKAALSASQIRALAVEQVDDACRRIHGANCPCPDLHEADVRETEARLLRHQGAS